MSDFTIQAFVLGFSFAGLICNSFEFLTGRPANFGLMFARGNVLLLCLPLLLFSAPYILARNVFRAAGVYGLGRNALICTLLASVVWSIMCGRVVLMLIASA